MPNIIVLYGSEERRLPRYKEAWLEMGKLMLDVGRPDAALSAFENILKFDRDYPGFSPCAAPRLGAKPLAACVHACICHHAVA